MQCSPCSFTRADPLSAERELSGSTGINPFWQSGQYQHSSRNLVTPSCKDAQRLEKLTCAASSTHGHRTYPAAIYFQDAASIELQWRVTTEPAHTQKAERDKHCLGSTSNNYSTGPMRQQNFREAARRDSDWDTGPFELNHRRAFRDGSKPQQSKGHHFQI